MANPTIIYDGSNGIKFTFNVSDANGDGVNLAGATVYFIILNSAERIEKTCIIEDEENGICSIVLSDTDLENIGKNWFQIKTSLLSGDVFLSNISSFEVKKSL